MRIVDIVRGVFLLGLLVGGLAWAQSGSASQVAGSAAVVPMDATVLTIKGFCPGQQPSPGAACQTVITRAQFEALASAIQPSMNPVVKRQLASLYPRLLVMSHQAEAEGLDKESQYQQMMAYARMQILTQALTRKLQEDSAKISDAEVADYYQQHLEMFCLYKLQRLFIPLHKQSPQGHPENNVGQKARTAETAQEQAAREMADVQEMTKLAEALRARAAAGESFVKLQKEAFDAAGIKVAAVNTSMGELRRTSVPAAHFSVFQLKEGEVSLLITDAAGHYVYKLEAKTQPTLNQVRDEVRGMLISQRIKDAMEKIQNSYTTQTNENYFAPTISGAAGAEEEVSPRRP